MEGREGKKPLYKYIEELYSYIRYDTTGTILLDYNIFIEHIIKIIDNPIDSFKLWKECVKSSPPIITTSIVISNLALRENIENALINVICPLQKIENIREKIETNEKKILSNALRDLWFHIRH